jgi:allophanate hydrolase
MVGILSAQSRIQQHASALVRHCKAFRMHLSLDFATLGRLYEIGGMTPSALIEALAPFLVASDAASVWISRRDAAGLAARAAAVEAAAMAQGRQSLPLYGLPFAVKDNIDVAGLPTTAGCPAFAYQPEESAPVVSRLEAAGAICLGKTNLDQFASGLVGTRSPYGTPRNPRHPGMVPGGSSSGSAVAVAAGLASFSLGTDTAGSGRVPAAFTGIVGLKPSRGLIPAAGVVPACRSLDCVSIFANNAADAIAVLAVAAGFDAADPYTRVAPPGYRAALAPLPARFTFAVPRAETLAGAVDAETKALFAAAAARLAAIGGQPLEINLAPFLEAAALLYGGAFVAERLEAAGTLLDTRPDALHPVVRAILATGRGYTAAEAFAAANRVAALRLAAAPVWDEADCLLLPTTPSLPSLAEVAADPIGANAKLGRFTNFVNLFDLSAIAYPAGERADALPFGVSLIAPAFHEPLIGAIAAAACAGASAAAAEAAAYPYLEIAVCGAHMRGEPLNPALCALGARFRCEASTTPEYRLFVLPDGRRPGLVRAGEEGGAAIALEVWDVPGPAVGALLASIAPPLGLGTVMLADGTAVKGFLCEAGAVAAAEEITRFGGWREARRQREARGQREARAGR